MGKKMNVDLRGKTIKILNLDDKIKKGDFCRPLHESPERDGGFSTTYKPNNWQGTRWQSVKNELPGWIGRTQRDYLHFNSSKKERKKLDKANYMEFEIVRIVNDI